MTHAIIPENGILFSPASSDIDKPQAAASHEYQEFEQSFKSARIAAAVAFVVLPRHLRLDLTLTASVRVLEFWLSRKFRNRIELISTGIFILCCWEIMYSWFYHPDSLPKSYNHWIFWMSELDPAFLQFLRNMKSRKLQYGTETGFGLEDLLKEYAEMLKIDPILANPRYGFIECETVLHPNQTCSTHAMFRGSRGFTKSIPLYLSLYTIPFLLSYYNSRKRKTLNDGFGLYQRLYIMFKDPDFQTKLARSVTSAVRSSTFLAVFIFLVWNTVCKVRNNARDDVVWGPLLASLSSGFSILIERPSRRPELAFYVLPRAIYSFLNRFLWRSFVLRSLHTLSRLLKYLLQLLELVVFSSSTAGIVATALQNSKHSRPFIRTMVQFLLK